jgi:hypothetical protein
VLPAIDVADLTPPDHLSDLVFFRQVLSFEFSGHL